MKTVNNINLAAESAYSKPMKWHKFLIYFSLWITGLSFIFAIGLSYLAGVNYGDQVNAVYAKYTNLKTVDIFFGLSYILFGIFVIVTRFKLARFRADAITCLTVCYILPIILDLLYLVFFFICTDLMYYSDFTNWLGLLVGNVVVLILTRIYYKKRSDLFTE